jgi:hypothetical protein
LAFLPLLRATKNEHPAGRRKRETYSCSLGDTLTFSKPIAEAAQQKPLKIIYPRKREKQQGLKVENEKSIRVGDEDENVKQERNGTELGRGKDWSFKVNVTHIESEVLKLETQIPSRQFQLEVSVIFHMATNKHKAFLATSLSA